MGYISNRMSTNAYKAYSKGLLPRSKITIKLLREKGWTYSASFFYWLCKQKYIMAKEFHHTTPMRKITAFYDLSNIVFINKNFDLDALYEVYLNRRSKRDIIKSKGVKYVRILIGRKILGTSNDVYLDCIKHNNLYWWSVKQCFKVNAKEIVLAKKYDENDLKPWYNPNKQKIERQILMLKNFYRKPK